MSEGKDKKDIRDVVTTGPPVAGLVSPSKANLIEPKTKEKEEKFGYERCTHCGYCRHVCKVYNTSWSETDYAGGRNRIIKALDRKDIKFDKEDIIPSVYRCMLCGNCKVVCPVGINTLEVFQNLRKSVVKKGAMPEKLKGLRKSILSNNNPFLEQHTDRFNWCEGSEDGKKAYERAKKELAAIEDTLAVEDQNARKEKPRKVGYFVGCTSAYRNKELVNATSEVLGKLGIEFVVFPEERCCGSVLFRTGLEDEALALVKHNYEMIRNSGVTEVVFSCSGCFSTFTLEYTKYAGGNLGFDLFHLTQYALRMVKEKNLKIRYTKRSKDNPLLITYHDPCHLGRYCNVYEEPRELIQMIEGVKLFEMKHNRDMAWCCGAGGGVKALYGDVAGEIGRDRIAETRTCMVRIREDRLKEALETNAEVLVSSCVFCKNNLFQVANEDNSPIKVMDISQLLNDCEFYQ
ncbi:MAG: (Fe-S)-binding protein [Candidatus Lokiarchaeota archaeon]|nr:(Fe-S)-binding protein [Candidatus Lokiarchaeota archaeon]